jgi:hypothetical protein
MKKKIGTVVSETLYDEVKILATQERRLISEIVGLALDEYVQRAKRKNPLQSGLTRFLQTSDFNLTNEQFRASMELDFLDQ